MEDNTLTIKQENAIVQYEGSLINDDITSDMIKIPRVSLLQSNSPIVQSGIETSEGLITVKIGTYHEMKTNENFGDCIDIVPIKLNRGALYMTEADGLVCKSDDRITNMHGGKCDECPWTDGAGKSCHYDNWTKDPSGKKIKPSCQKTYDVMVYVLASMSPAVMTFKSSGYGAWEDAVTCLKANAKKGHDGIRFKTQKIVDGMKTYHVPVFTYTFKASDADRADAMKWRQALDRSGYEVQGE